MLGTPEVQQHCVWSLPPEVSMLGSQHPESLTERLGGIDGDAVSWKEGGASWQRTGCYSES